VCGFFARTHSPRFTYNSPTRLHRTPTGLLGFISFLFLCVCFTRSIDQLMMYVSIDRQIWLELSACVLSLLFPLWSNDEFFPFNFCTSTTYQCGSLFVLYIWKWNKVWPMYLLIMCRRSSLFTHHFNYK
jgi:hypothetical protein